MNWKRIQQNWNENLRSVYQDSMSENFPLLTTLKDLSERYKEISDVGEGSQKKVVRAYDRLLKRDVALARPVHESDEAYEIFLAEAVLISGLEHPGIVNIYDIGQAGEIPYFTMELVEGDTLAAASEKYSLDDLLYIFQQICNAVSFAHSKGVLNLDLKPENIIVGPFFKVTVLDWGIAKEIQEGKKQKNSVEGTPGFMSPEQVKAEEVSEKTDVYMLGALLFFILFRKAPVAGSSAEELADNTIQGNLVKVENSEVPDALSKIALKALSHDLDKRYSSVQDLSAELRKYQHGFATEAEKASFLKQCYLMYCRNQLTMNFILLIILGAVLSLTFIFQQERRQKQQAEQARLKIEKLLSLYQDEKKLAGDLELGIDKALKFILSDNKGKDRDPDYLVKTVYRLSEEKNYDAVITFLLRLLKNDPENISAWRHLGFQYFIRQEFTKSSECFGQSDTDEDCIMMKKLSDKFAGKFEGKDFGKNDLLYVLKNGVDSEKWQWVVCHSLKYFSMSASLEDHLEVLTEVVAYYNPGSTIKASYEEGVLDLRESTGLKTLKLSDNYSLIDSLEVKKLLLPKGVDPVR
ncbi:MAG: protein kinase [Lentisphaeraceae bacterium]|nr:protein kinase [Lentisphaeraceae bacterium]